MWDGKVAGAPGGLASALGRKAPILPDLQAAIAAVRKAGRTGRARTRGPLEVMEMTKERQAELSGGLDAVRIWWAKAHVDIKGNEKADQLAEKRTESRIPQRQTTEARGGPAADVGEERKVKDAAMGMGMWRVVYGRWNWKARAGSTTSNAEPGRATHKPGATIWTTRWTQGAGNTANMRRQASTYIALACTHGRWWGDGCEDMDERRK